MTKASADVPRPSAIFLDAAGTLFRLREPVGQTYARIAARHGIHAEAGKLNAGFLAAWAIIRPPLHPEGRPSADDDRSWWSNMARTVFELATGTSFAPKDFEATFSDLYEHFARGDAWQLHDDTLPALDKLSRNARLFVLSNFDRRLRSILDGLGIAGYFERVIISSEVGASKPHPRMFHDAVEASGLAAHECLHVGDDRSADHRGAIDAGLQGFLLNRPQIMLKTVAEKLSGSDFTACKEPISA